MNKEDLNVLSDLLTNLKEAVSELEFATKNKDNNKLNAAKNKILGLQLKIDRII